MPLNISCPLNTALPSLNYVLSRLPWGLCSSSPNPTNPSSADDPASDSIKKTEVIRLDFPNSLSLYSNPHLHLIPFLPPPTSHYSERCPSSCQSLICLLVLWPYPSPRPQEPLSINYGGLWDVPPTSPFKKGLLVPAAGNAVSRILLLWPPSESARTS